MTPMTIVFALYEQMTQLDFTGPHQVLSGLKAAQLLRASAKGGIIISDDGLAIVSTRLDEIEHCDIICVPGGPGTATAMRDTMFLAQVKRLAMNASYVTSVCTGSLILGAAGLLRGRRVACHWAFRDQLAVFGAEPDPGRVVWDGNLVTGGGVTAGIDFALCLVAHLAGNAVAQAFQLSLEYAPNPPFNVGRPESAPPSILAEVEGHFKAMLAETRASALENLERTVEVEKHSASTDHP